MERGTKRRTSKTKYSTGPLQICWKMLYIKKINRFLLFTTDTSCFFFFLLAADWVQHKWSAFLFNLILSESAPQRFLWRSRSSITLIFTAHIFYLKSTDLITFKFSNLKKTPQIYSLCDDTRKTCSNKDWEETETPDDDMNFKIKTVDHLSRLQLVFAKRHSLPHKLWGSRFKRVRRKMWRLAGGLKGLRECLFLQTFPNFYFCWGAFMLCSLQQWGKKT